MMADAVADTGRGGLIRVIAEAAVGVPPADRAVALAAAYVLRVEVLPLADEVLRAALAPADQVLRDAFERKESAA